MKKHPIGIDLEANSFEEAIGVLKGLFTVDILEASKEVVRRSKNRSEMTKNAFMLILPLLPAKMPVETQYFVVGLSVGIITASVDQIRGERLKNEN